MRTLRLLNLHCNKTFNDDDVNNPKLNEALLAVENGIFHVFGPKSMMNKSEWMINVDVQFNKQAKISFFDEDLIRNLSTTNNFRNYIIEENEVHNGPKVISFATNNAKYVLTFEII
jgi:hypothetical protein